MASQTNNILTTAAIILVLVTLFTGLYFTSIDISSNNDKLDIESQNTINDISGYYVNNINGTSFTASEGQYNDSSFDDVDPFVRQYLEDKTEIQEKQSILNKVLLYPSIMISVFGVSDSTVLLIFSSLVYSFIGFIITLQIFKAIKGEVD